MPDTPLPSPPAPAVHAGAERYEEIFTRGISTTQRQTLAWVPPGSRVLELGCASGYMSRWLRDKKGCQVTGVEVDPAAAERARSHGLTVHVGSLDDERFLDAIEGSFDMILANDVLEHLVEPERALHRVLGRLAPGGRLVISTPNIAAWQVRAKLFFEGEFRYEEHGIMDRTHVHFFTWDTFHEMLERQRLEVLDRVHETVDIPLGMRLLIDWPLAAVRRIEGRIGDERGLRRWLDQRRLSSIHHVVRWRERGQAVLAERWPNLCLPHIAVLVAPAAGAQG